MPPPPPSRNLLPGLKVAKFRCSSHIKKDPEVLLRVVKAFINDPSVCATLGTTKTDKVDDVKLER